jgi:hypothetical protein
MRHRARTPLGVQTCRRPLQTMLRRPASWRPLSRKPTAKRMSRCLGRPPRQGVRLPTFCSIMSGSSAQRFVQRPEPTQGRVYRPMARALICSSGYASVRTRTGRNGPHPKETEPRHSYCHSHPRCYLRLPPCGQGSSRSLTHKAYGGNVSRISLCNRNSRLVARLCICALTSLQHACPHRP